MTDVNVEEDNIEMIIGDINQFKESWTTDFVELNRALTKKCRNKSPIKVDIKYLMKKSNRLTYAKLWNISN